VKIRLIYSGAANGFSTYYFPTISTLTLSTAPLVSNNFVQGNGTGGELSGAKTSLAYAANNTVGDLLVVSFHGKTELLDSITDTMGNDWTLVYKRVDGSGTLDGWGYAFSKATRPNTVSLNWDAPSSGVVMSIGEWSGPNAFRDADNGNRQEGASRSSNAIVTAGGDLLIGEVGTSKGGSYNASGKGWTLRTQGKANGVTYTGISDNLDASFGSAKATFATSVGSAGIAGIGVFYNDGRANRAKAAQ
jgi:hypothetical protein